MDAGSIFMTLFWTPFLKIFIMGSMAIYLSHLPFPRIQHVLIDVIELESIAQMKRTIHYLNWFKIIRVSLFLLKQRRFPLWQELSSRSRIHSFFVSSENLRSSLFKKGIFFPKLNTQFECALDYCLFLIG